MAACPIPTTKVYGFNHELTERQLNTVMQQAEAFAESECAKKTAAEARHLRAAGAATAPGAPAPSAPADAADAGRGATGAVVPREAPTAVGMKARAGEVTSKRACFEVGPFRINEPIVLPDDI